MFKNQDLNELFFINSKIIFKTYYITSPLLNKHTMKRDIYNLYEYNPYYWIGPINWMQLFSEVSSWYYDMSGIPNSYLWSNLF